MQQNFLLKSSLYALSAVASLLCATSAHAAAPSISTVSPTTATTNVQTTLSATINADAALQSCNLYVDLADVGAMNINGNTASLGYTFTSGGSRIAFVFCRDQAGNIGAGPNTSIWVQGAIVPSDSFSGSNSGGSSNTQPTQPTQTTATTTASATTTVTTPVVPVSTGLIPGTLVKLACGLDADVNDPCKAVYYIGRDGKRHSFPNARVFFTWYNNFDTVTIITADMMRNTPIGKNVTYRPGLRLVKFTSVNRVYAVSASLGLRWVTTESLAINLFGSDWNTKIDDIDDTFYANYTFGADINTANDYNATIEQLNAPTIDSVL